MKFFPKISVVLVCLGMVSLSVRADDGLQLKFDDSGTPIFSVGGELISFQDGPLITGVRFYGPDFKRLPHGASNETFPLHPDDQKPVSDSWDATTKRRVQTFAWGSVTWQWVMADGGVNLDVTIENKTTDRTLCDLIFTISDFRFSSGGQPAQVTERPFFGQPSPAVRMDSLSGPMVLPMIFGSRALVAASPETGKYLELQWSAKKPGRAADQPGIPEHGDAGAKLLAENDAKRGTSSVGASEDWKLVATIGGEQLIWHDRYASRPIPPGKSDRFRISLRLGRAEVPLAPAADLLKDYADKVPQVFKWDDRRPILRSFIGDGFPYHLPADAEGTKPQGISPSAEFRARVLEQADEIVASLKAADAQGFILWNVEGGNDNRVKYVGSPAMVEKMCPEMDQVADEFFAKIRKAGFRPGVCLRPSTILPEERDGKLVWLHRYPRDRDVVDVLDEKIRYAKKRWGCSLFYIDTNEVYKGAVTEEEKAEWPKDASGKIKPYHATMNAEQWEELARRHPDVLLIPEHSYLRCYSSSAAYDQVDMGCEGTPPLVRAVWPESFKFLALSLPLGKYWDQTVEAISEGNVVSVNIPLGPGEVALVQARREASLRGKAVPPDLAALDDEKLLAQIVQGTGESDRRWLAARLLQTKKGLLPDEALKALFSSDDWLLRVSAWQGIREVSQFPILREWFTAQMQDSARQSLDPFAAAAINRLGGGSKEVVVEWIRGQAALPGSMPLNRLLVLLSETPGTVPSQILGAVLADDSLPAAVRVMGGRQLGRRKDASDKAAALQGLTPFLKVAPVRGDAAAALLKTDPKLARPLVEAAIAELKGLQPVDTEGIEKLQAELSKAPKK